MEVVKETDLSIVILKSLEFPKDRYWEFTEHEKPFFSNEIHSQMYGRLKAIYQVFSDLYDYAKGRGMFLVKFQIITPRPTLIPPQVQSLYFEFVKSYQKIEYQSGRDLEDQLDIIIGKLLDVLTAYRHVFPDFVNYP